MPDENQERSKKLRILCLDGGGYLGLATASFLRATEKHFGVRCADVFDLFVGTSTGGLIAIALASGMSAAEVEELYRKMGMEVFPAKRAVPRFFRWLRRFLVAKYGSQRLRRVLSDAFGDQTLAHVGARGKSLVVPAFSTSSGQPRIFKTDHAPELTRDSKVSLVDIAMATSAAPTYFKAAKVHHPMDGTPAYYIDGGVFANNPSMIGLVEALTYLDIEPGNVELLSLSTPRSDLRISRGWIPWITGILAWGSKLPELFVNGPSQLTERAVSELSRKLGFAHVRVHLQQATNPLPMDLASASSTDELIHIGVSEANANDTRRRLAQFFIG